MAELHQAENGTPWFSITWHELVEYSCNDCPICDQCVQSLLRCDDIVLIPILNEAYCPRCGKEKLEQLHRYPEDAAIEERRTRFYLEYFQRAGKGGHRA